MRVRLSPLAPKETWLSDLKHLTANEAHHTGVVGLNPTVSAKLEGTAKWWASGPENRGLSATAVGFDSSTLFQMCTHGTSGNGTAL